MHYPESPKVTIFTLSGLVNALTKSVTGCQSTTKNDKFNSKYITCSVPQSG